MVTQEWEEAGQAEAPRFAGCCWTAEMGVRALRLIDKTAQRRRREDFDSLARAMPALSPRS